MEAECLFSVEQEQALEKVPEFRQELFVSQFNRNHKEEKLKKLNDEWECARCFKH